MPGVSSLKLEKNRGRSLLYAIYCAAERFGQPPQWALSLDWVDQVRLLAFDTLRTLEEQEQMQSMAKAGMAGMVHKVMVGR